MGSPIAFAKPRENGRKTDATEIADGRGREERITKCISTSSQLFHPDRSDRPLFPNQRRKQLLFVLNRMQPLSVLQAHLGDDRNRPPCWRNTLFAVIESFFAILFNAYGVCLEGVSSHRIVAVGFTYA